jgi:hypothetical protein
VVLEGGCRRAGLLLLGVLLGCGVSAGQDRAPDRGGAAAETSALTRFLARPDEPITSYRAYRRMEVRGMGQRAWMNVRVDLDREHGFRWVIESEGGSSALRDKTLRRLLETEAEAHATGIAARSGLTQDNYQVEAAGRDPDGLVRLRAQARRRDSVLRLGHRQHQPDRPQRDAVRGAGRRARGLQPLT